MRWTFKAHGMALISRLPAGAMLYHALQRMLRTNRLRPQEGIARVAEIVDLIKRAGGTLEGSTCVEIGTGWRPYLPLILHLAGVSKTITFDINPWLTYSYAAETDHVIRTLTDQASAAAGIDHDTYSRRLPDPSAVKTLPDLLSAYHVEYVSPGDAAHTSLEDRSVDFVCSSNVLEHVPPEILRNIHRESCRLLKPGGLAVHRFNPGDHFASVDRSITTANFLRFSEADWKWYGGSGLSYHNRLRCSEHAELLASAGLQVVHSAVRTDQRAVQAIRSGDLKVHPDYSKFSAEELSADYMWIVASPKSS